MDKNHLALVGIIGLLIAYISIGVSLALSPWFCWCNNALSDLGHVVRSNAAPIYNFGLLSSGWLVSMYAIVLRKYAKYTGYTLLTSSFLLQLVATFDETYSLLHTQVSTLFFVSLGVASFTFVLEKRSQIAVASLIIGVLTWLLYFTETYKSGIAVPEIISVVTVSTWIILSVFNIFLGRYPERPE